MACGMERTGIARRVASAASTLSRSAAFPTTTQSHGSGTLSAANPLATGIWSDSSRVDMGG